MEAEMLVIGLVIGAIIMLPITSGYALKARMYEKDYHRVIAREAETDKVLREFLTASKPTEAPNDN